MGGEEHKKHDDVISGGNSDTVTLNVCYSFYNFKKTCCHDVIICYFSMWK